MAATNYQFVLVKDNVLSFPYGGANANNFTLEDGHEKEQPRATISSQAGPFAPKASGQRHNS
jgi:hypothetical protein